MIKKLIGAAAFTLLSAASVSVAYGQLATKTEKYPYITGSVAFPVRVRPSIASSVRHTFRIQIPQESSALSHLTIDVPKGLIVRNNISVSDQYGRKVDTNVSVNGKKVFVAFPSPVAPGTQLEIDMNNVRMSGVSNGWIYRIYAKLVGFDVDIPIGVAQFRFY